MDATIRHDITTRTPTVHEAPLTLYERVLRLYNGWLNRELALTDYDFWMMAKLAYSNNGRFQRFVNARDERRFHIAHFFSMDDGLQGYVIRSRLTQDLIIAFRGTDEWKDWLTNVQILKGKKGQFQTAIPLLEDIFSRYPDHRYYLCGHSLGGALAQVLFAYFHPTTPNLKRAVTFNSAGVRRKNEPAYPNLPIDNFVIVNDLVGSMTGYHYGKVHPCVPKYSKNKLDALTFMTHRLDQFSFDEKGRVLTLDHFTQETG